MQYISFDQVVKMVRGCNEGAQLLKCNIMSTFCLLPGHPDISDLLGFIFVGKIYMDIVLPMGYSISCSALSVLAHFCSGRST